MAAPNTFTYSQMVVLLATVELQDHIRQFSWNESREQTDYATFGVGNNPAVGRLSIEGTIAMPYQFGAGDPYETARTELFTATAGGVAMVIRPNGTGTGNPEYTFNAIVSGADHDGEEADVQEGEWAFASAGTITYAVQS